MFTNKKSLIVIAVLSATSALAQMPEWSYDTGPIMGDIPCNEQNKDELSMGCQLIDITANIPNMPQISNEIMGRSQKFRPAFGPIPWRMRQEANKVKMLFIGQDGTHIAEAAGRPATAGFGGRAQDLANYFGVNEGAAFMNAYSFTIKGQYGIYGSPYIYTKNGESSVRTANLVGNDLWLMTNSLESPIVKWRNSLIDWILRNNKKSMKLIVLFGGAARDTIATFAKSMGAEVVGGNENDMKYIQVPETKSEYAGGNNTFPSLVAQDGGDLYSDVVGRKLVYTNAKDQKAALDSLKTDLKEYLKKAVFTKGGPYGNGLLNSAQLGGYDLDTMIVNGMRTRSLRGLTLSDGTKIENDVVVISLPHPSYLSRAVMEAESYAAGKRRASDLVMKDVKKLDKFKAAGWKIEPDINKTNFYDRGERYEYGRSDIGPEFYDFGTPKNRMVSKSTAKRMGGAANVVIIGTRDNGKFSRSEIKKMTDAKAAKGVDRQDLYIARPRTLENRYVFDAGPGEKMARVMKENLDLEKIFAPKEGMSFEADGIDAFNIKTHPSVGDFGHYRGTFNNPKVVVIADPVGYDDLITARALTGTRGQYIQGMMDDLGVNDNYLVIKTVPFGMDGATTEEWNVVYEQTRKYRKAIIEELLKSGKPVVVMSDGVYAGKAANELFKGTGITRVSLYRGKSTGELDKRRIKRSKRLKEALGASNVRNIKGNMANIPRSHLTFYSRVWEGTSGDRVITSEGKAYKGLAFAEVVPSWAYKQNWSALEKTWDTSSEGIEALRRILRDENLPLPGEKIPAYLRRTNIDPSFAFMQFVKNWIKLIA